MRRAELVQADRRLVAVPQQHAAAVGRLADTEALHIQHHAVHTGDAGLGRTGDGRKDISGTDRTGTSYRGCGNGPYRDAQSLQDVELADGTGAVLVQPRVHAHFMEDVSARRARRIGAARQRRSDKTNNGAKG